jgi:hypothetical protein
MKCSLFTALILFAITITFNIPFRCSNSACGGVMHPDEVTNSHISITKNEIEAYAKKFNRLPGKLSKLSDLPPSDPHDKPGSSITDGWGQPLIYEPQTDGSVVLGSLGESGKNNARSMRFSVIGLDDDDADKGFSTLSSMVVVEGAIRLYAKTNHQLPNRLSDIKGDPRIRRTVDAWGRPMMYIPNPDGSVILSSQGKIGSNQIFSRQFTVPGIQTKGPTTATTENTK